MQDAEKLLRLYIETGDATYFTSFLETFAPQLDRRIPRFAKLYKLEHHIEDLKSVYIETILTELPSYNPTLKVPFFAFAEKHLLEALHDYARLNGGAFAIGQAGHYRRLRAAAYFYYSSDLQTHHERIHSVAERLRTSADAVQKLLAEAEAFRFYDGIYPFENNDNTHEPNDINFSDASLDPSKIVERELLRDELIDATEKVLGFREQQLLLRSCGIRCIYCGRLCKRETYAELANHFEYSSASTVEKARKKVIENLVYALCDRNILACVKLVRKKLTKTELVYSYLVNGDNGSDSDSKKPTDDGTGLISFDLTETAASRYTIERLAALDTIKSHRYAKRVVELVGKMNRDFPKELLLVWWA